MDRLDRGFELEAADLPDSRSRGQLALGLVDHGRDQSGDVLLGEGDVVALWRPAGGPARLAMEEERQEPTGLGLDPGRTARGIRASQSASSASPRRR